MKKKFSIILPIYGNEKNLPVTVPYILDNIPTLFPEYDVELIMVNDGSPDNAYSVMKDYQKQYPDVIKIASFTRNFGQIFAIEYGMKMATGDVVGAISADLQDPLELFAEMLKYWEQGDQLVYGVRTKRNDRGSIFSKITHSLIHNIIMKNYPKGGFDFFIMDRGAAEQFLEVNERNGSPQVLMLWFGFKSHGIPYERKVREIGKSGYNFSRKFKLFIDTFVSNTYLPLRVMSVIGTISAIGAFIYIVYLIISMLVSGGASVPGWASIISAIAFFSGLILLSLGIIGEYLWRIFDYVKLRPRYVVKETIDDTADKKTV